MLKRHRRSLLLLRLTELKSRDVHISAEKVMFSKERACVRGQDDIQESSTGATTILILTKLISIRLCTAAQSFIFGTCPCYVRKTFSPGAWALYLGVPIISARHHVHNSPGLPIILSQH
jgi:hypothetical protein